LRRIPWDEASWLNPPPEVVRDGDDLLVTAERGSDFWRTTSYGYDRDSGHALLAPLAPEAAVEATFAAAFTEQFDQAGLLIRLDERTWIKAGVEFADGIAQAGAVVTRDRSDWSTGPVPDWTGRTVTIRASRSGDAVTVRGRAEDEPWRMLRVAPFPEGVPATAGIYCCAPTRSGLTVRFTRLAFGDPDRSLHA
jgi:regulation of enolase protein 1 (concanavalin A-like superfamily)